MDQTTPVAHDSLSLDMMVSMFREDDNLPRRVCGVRGVRELSNSDRLGGLEDCENDH